MRDQEAGGIRVWSESDELYLQENYGFVPIGEICHELNITRNQAHSKAARLGLTRRAKCRTCGTVFVGTGGRGKRFYCSGPCRRQSQTARHRRYVSHNRLRLAEYVKARKLRLWGESNCEIARQAERLAVDKILPKLEFTDLFHASVVSRYFPFDVVGTHEGRRVLIDITTAVSKSLEGTNQLLIGDALGMKVYVLFVKPDFTKYQLVPCHGSKSAQMHITELVSVE